MKKVISLVLALALAASVLCTVAFAADSKSDVVTVVNGSKSDLVTVVNGSKSNLINVVNGSKGTLIDVVNASKSGLVETANVTTTESKVEPATEAEVDAAVAAAIEAAKENVDVELLKSASAAKMTLIAQADFTADTYPCVLNFYGEGTENIYVVVLVKYENTEDWTVVYAGLAGEFSAEVEANGTYAVYMVG